MLKCSSSDLFNTRQVFYLQTTLFVSALVKANRKNLGNLVIFVGISVYNIDSKL